MDEFFDIIDADGRCIGIAPRHICHGNPALMHRTAHVVVKSSDGRILLQKRSMSKDIQPGKWDTAVGGHLALGESYLQGAIREMREEIGVSTAQMPAFLFSMTIRNDVESEQTAVFGVVSDGPFTPMADEIDDLRFWTADELRQAMDTGTMTPYLERELKQLFKTDFIATQQP